MLYRYMLITCYLCICYVYYICICAIYMLYVYIYAIYMQYVCICCVYIYFIYLFMIETHFLKLGSECVRVCYIVCGFVILPKISLAIFCA